jgi:transposase
MKIATYDTDLTDAQWHLLRRFLPAAKKRGRQRTALREAINAILYLVKTGAQWRLLPKNFPPAMQQHRLQASVPQLFQQIRFEMKTIITFAICLT